MLKELHLLPVEHRTNCKIPPHLQGTKWPCSAKSHGIIIKIYTTLAPPFGESISPQYTEMMVWNVSKSSFRQGSPKPSERSSPQSESNSFCWFFQDHGLFSLSEQTSYRKILWSREALRLFQSLWNLGGISAKAPPRCLSNSRAIQSL